MRLPCACRTPPSRTSGTSTAVPTLGIRSSRSRAGLSGTLREVLAPATDEGVGSVVVADPAPLEGELAALVSRCRRSHCWRRRRLSCSLRQKAAALHGAAVGGRYACGLSRCQSRWQALHSKQLRCRSQRPEEAATVSQGGDLSLVDQRRGGSRLDSETQGSISLPRRSGSDRNCSPKSTILQSTSPGPCRACWSFGCRKTWGFASIKTRSRW